MGSMEKYDAFISYARVDDVPFDDQNEKSKWVSMIVAHLKTILDQRLGRRNAAKLFFDTSSLPGNTWTDDALKEALGNSATLVIIMTEGYLESEWCLRECAYFDEMHENVNGRVFILNCDSIRFEDPRYPKQFRGITAYPFFRKSSQLSEPARLGFPAPLEDGQRQSYCNQLNKIRTDLAMFLKNGNPPAAPVPDSRLTPPPIGPVPVSATATKPVEKAVYIAEASPDLNDRRDELKSYLIQTGHKVFPESTYPRDPNQFVEAMRADLEKCLLFVQILGPWQTVQSDELPLGYEKLQLDVALEMNKGILRWRSDGLDLSKISSDPYRDFLQSHGTMASPFEEFKLEIVKQAIEADANESVEGAHVDDDFVLLGPEPCDKRLATNLAAEIENVGYGFVDMLGGGTLEAVAAKKNYKGMMVLYGSCDPENVEKRISECRRVLLRKKKSAPACGLYIGPPEDKPDLSTYPATFHVMNSPDQLTSFIEAIAQK